MVKLASAVSTALVALAVTSAPAVAPAAPASTDSAQAQVAAGKAKGKSKGGARRGARRGGSKPLYLALGDSLAVGIQPGPDGVPRATRQGYPNQIARKLGLRLVNYGCGWASSRSIMDASRPCLPKPNPRFRNKGRRTSQLATAERFLRRNRGRVALVTIDIGANDVAGCESDGAIDLQCATDGVTAIRNNTPKIGRRLRRAAGPGVPLAAMTVYNPFVALWLDGGGDQVLARLSQDLARDQVNSAISSAFEPHGFAIADVAAAFKAYEPVPTDGAVTRPPPVAVARVCRLTWMCTPAPRGPDIHANKRGHATIARTFRKAVRKPLRQRLRALR